MVVVAPVDVASVYEVEGLRSAAEVYGEVGGKDGVFETRYHTLKLFLKYQIRFNTMPRDSLRLKLFFSFQLSLPQVNEVLSGAKIDSSVIWLFAR